MIDLLANRITPTQFFHNSGTTVATAQFKYEGWSSFLSGILATFKVFFESFKSKTIDNKGADLSEDPSQVTLKKTVTNYKHNYNKMRQEIKANKNTDEQTKFITK